MKQHINIKYENKLSLKHMLPVWVSHYAQKYDQRSLELAEWLDNLR